MKRVIKNVLKSTAIICLILEIASTIFFGLYTLELNKAYKNNDKEWTQGLISVGKSYRE